MPTVGSLKVLIEGDMKPYLITIRQAESATKGLAGTLRRTLPEALRATTTAADQGSRGFAALAASTIGAARAVNALAAAWAGSRIVRGVLDMAQAAHQAEAGARVFERMLARVGESAQGVEPRLQALADELRVVPDIIRSNAAELLRAGYTWQQIETIYRGAGASALLAGKSTQEGIEIATSALVSGLSVYLNQIGIIQNLNTAYQQYARSLGKTVDELTDTERAQAATLMIQRATAQEVADLDLLLQGYGGAVSDFSRAWYDLKVAIGDVFLPVLTPLIRALATVIGWVGKGVEAVRKFWREFFVPGSPEEVIEKAVTPPEAPPVPEFPVVGPGAGKTPAQVLDELQVRLQGINTMLALAREWGWPFDAATERVQALQRALDELINLGLTETDNRVRQVATNLQKALDDQAEATRRAQAEMRALEDAANAVINVFRTRPEEVTDGFLEAARKIRERLPESLRETLDAAFDEWEQGMRALAASLIESLSRADMFSVLAPRGWQEMLRDLELGILTPQQVMSLLGLPPGSRHQAASILQEYLRQVTDAIEVERLLAPLEGRAFGELEELRHRLRATTDAIRALGEAGVQPTSALIKLLADDTERLRQRIDELQSSVQELSSLDIVLKSLSQAFVGQRWPREANQLLQRIQELRRQAATPGPAAALIREAATTRLQAIERAIVDTWLETGNAMQALWAALDEAFQEQIDSAKAATAALDAYAQRLTALAQWYDEQDAQARQARFRAEQAYAARLTALAKAHADEQARLGLERAWRDRAMTAWAARLQAQAEASEREQQAAEARAKAWSDFRQELLGAIPVLAGQALQGAVAMAPAGPWGMLVGALLPLITNSKQFAALMNVINPLLQTLADTIGAVLQPFLPLIKVVAGVLNPVLTILGTILANALLPALSFMFPIIKLAGLALLYLGKGVSWVINKIIEGVNFFIRLINKLLGWLGIRIKELGTIPLQNFDKAIEELKNLTWDQAAAMEDLTESAREASEALRNVPSGFKYVLARFSVAEPVSLAEGGIATHPIRAVIGDRGPEAVIPLDRADIGTTIVVEINGTVYGMDDFDRRVREAVDRAARRAGMASYGMARA